MGLKVWMGCVMPKIAIGSTGLSENLGRDDEIKRAQYSRLSSGPAARHVSIRRKETYLATRSKKRRLYSQFMSFVTLFFLDTFSFYLVFQLVFLNIFLVFLGLSILSITLSMIASNIHHQMQKASFIEKLKDTEMSDTSSVVGSAVGLGDEENSNGHGNRGRRGSGDDSTIAAKDTNGGKSYGSTESSP